MLITNHVLAGALIGSRARSLPAAVLTGFASHFVLDAVPHYRLPEDVADQIAVADGLSGLTAVAAALLAAQPGQRARVAAGIVGSCLPDLDKPGRRFTGRSPFPAAFDRLHSRIQTELPQLIDVEVAAAALLAAGLAARGRRR